MSDRTVLVMGYGNPGRLDDGLGPAFCAALESVEASGLSVESDYQLTVEDAATVAEHDIVVFVDAAVEGPEPFFLRRCLPRPGMSYSSHSVTPEGVMGLARQLFDAETAGYVLGIHGYEFNEFGERLSEQARFNLEQGLEFFHRLLPERRFEQGLTRFDPEDNAADSTATVKEDKTCKTANT